MPKRITITLSDELASAIELLRKRRKYRNSSEYFVALARYDGQSQRDHALTEDWAALTGHERDRLDAGILKLVESGEGIKGSWLTKEIERVIEKLIGRNDGITPASVKAALPAAIVKSLDIKSKD